MSANNPANDKKISKTIDKLMKIINKANLNVPELILVYGNLGYHIGASMAGFEEKGPSLEEIKKEYYSNPTVDSGLMLQGLLISSWEEDYLKNPSLSRLSKLNLDKKEQ